MVGAALAPPPGPNSKTATMPETRPRNVEHLVGQPGDHQAVAFVRGQLARTRCHPRVQGSRQALPNRRRPDEGHPQASTWTKRAGMADLRTAERVQGSASCRSYSAIRRDCGEINAPVWAARMTLRDHLGGSTVR